MTTLPTFSNYEKTLFSITRHSGVAVIDYFQEEHRHLVLISHHNSILNLLCTAAICMNANKNFVPLHNDSLHLKLLPYLLMMHFVSNEAALITVLPCKRSNLAHSLASSPNQEEIKSYLSFGANIDMFI